MKAAVSLSFMAALAAGQIIPAPPGLNANIGINPNPNRNFDPAKDQGNKGTFTVSTAAVAAATGGPSSVDPATAQSMQLAIRNWMSDTTVVSQFLNTGKSISDPTQFKSMADGAFKAEVDELTNMGALNKAIGNDPRVSIANQTLLNGVFQMVVDNLQIMSFQGPAKSNLIDTINAGRCTQVLPSIDTYMIVAAESMQKSNISGFQSRAARPDACTGAVAAVSNDASQNPPLPGTPFGNPKGKSDGNVPGLNGLSLTQGGTNNAAIASTASTASTASSNNNSSANNGNAGNTNSGSTNSGSTNSGSTNSGSTNTGNTNSGSTNSGNTNAGNGEASNGNESSGNESNSNASNGQESNGNESNSNASNGQESNGKASNSNASKGQESNGKASNSNASNGQESNGKTSNSNASKGQESNGKASNGQESNANANNDKAINSRANGPSGNNAGSSLNSALPNTTTQELGLPNFPNKGAGGSPNGKSENGNTIGSTPSGLGNSNNGGNANAQKGNGEKASRWVPFEA